MTTSVAPSIDFTARTFERLRERGLELLRLRVGDYRYRSFVATDIAPAIIDVVAWYNEQSAHYSDRRRLNSLLILADNRDDMSVLTQAQGYRMRPATSASVAVLATPLPPQAAPITLVRGTRITVGELTFEVAQDAIIPAGATEWPDGTTDDLVVLVEGATVVESYVSDGAEFQMFQLGQPQTIDDSIEVTILNETWEEVPSLVFVEGDQRGRDTFIGDSTDTQEYTLSLLNAIVGLEDEDGIVLLVQPAGESSSSAVPWQQVSAFTGAPREFVVVQDLDGTTRVRFGLAADGSAPLTNDTIDVHYVITGAQKRYSVTFDPEDRATIQFGDGLFGVIPTAGATIEVRYRVGGGVRGNIPIQSIDALIRGDLPNGAKASVRVRNFERGSGGESAETVEHARFFAPRITKSNNRAVTQSDWTAWASTFVDPLYGAPAHANAYLKQSIPELNTVCVAVWGRDESGALATPGTPLKLAIKKFLDTKRTITTTTEMKDGTVVLLDIEADIVLEVGASRQTVFAAVTEAVERFFLSSFVMPGVDLSISRLYRTIDLVDGVERAEIKNVTGSVSSTLELGDGDGLTKQFSFNFVLEEGTTIVPESILVSDGSQQIVDDGDGGFTGDIDGTGTNTVDYSTGVGTITFDEAPSVGTTVQASAKLGHFFPYTEDLGPSDGNVTNLNGGTDYYPILQRAPRGMWSGDQVRVVDSFQIGTTAQVRGDLPGGIIPGTFAVTDSTGAPQTGIDNGAGVITGPGIASGSIDYTTGLIDFFFNNPPVLPIRVSWQTKTLDIYVEEDLLPLTPGRVYIWGGYSANGIQPGGAELIGADDGEGNIFGDILVGGTIDYTTGRIRAEFNLAPPPGPGGGATLVGTLVPAPDGTTTQFAWSVPGDLSSAALGGEGRTRFQFSDLSTPGVTFEDAYDNWQGQINGASLDREGVNTVIYSLGSGTVTFEVPPAATAPATFAVQVTNVATLMVAGWVYRVPDPSGLGLEKGLFSDNNGRLWGPPGAGSSNPYPTDRLEHQRGRYIAALAGSAVPAGYSQELTYDSLTGVPPSLDVPIAGDEVASLGRVVLREKTPETQAF